MKECSEQGRQAARHSRRLHSWDYTGKTGLSSPSKHISRSKIALSEPRFVNPVYALGNAGGTSLLEGLSKVHSIKLEGLPQSQEMSFHIGLQQRQNARRMRQETNLQEHSLQPLWSVHPVSVFIPGHCVHQARQYDSVTPRCQYPLHVVNILFSEVRLASPFYVILAKLASALITTRVPALLPLKTKAGAASLLLRCKVEAVQAFQTA